MVVDILVVAFMISAVFRGREIGFVRQICSTIGFFGGLGLGLLLESHTIHLVHSALSRSVVTLITVLGSALLLLTLGEYAGIRLKQKVHGLRINSLDNALGAFLSVISVLIATWLSASIVASLPLPDVKAALKDSRIVTFLNKTLPPAPDVIADLGHLIDPNGFPQVFNGIEPVPPSSVNLPNLGDLQAAVNKDRPSVVKIEGRGCGGIVEGSGFVVAPGLVATNAHVIAGIHRPFVQDSNGTHDATAVWFDANLDFALLRVDNLAGSPLSISRTTVPPNTAGAVLGYPGGGSFTAGPAVVLDEFIAAGRNIYNRGISQREVYELAADIIPGNSGGPLILKDGTVVGVIFAESTTYNHVGYALTSDQVVDEIHQAQARNQPVSTGSCAE